MIHRAPKGLGGTLTFRNRSSKRKGGNRPLSEEEEEVVNAGISKCSGKVDEADEQKKHATEVSKKKTKEKKVGRAVRQDEDDEIDKILAELGEWPTVVKSAPALMSEEKLPESTVESAEENNKTNKNDGTNGKLGDGKEQSRQVKEMQERLKRRKEVEERRKKDEEERLRKEEEERLRLEEVERLEEEKKRLKKEREKEKMLRKKQEEKLLTGKQKEEARRLEAMRKQFLTGGRVEVSRKEATKRPIYQAKKTKPQGQTNGKAKDESQVPENQQENVFEIYSKSEVADADAEEDGIEEDEEWDARSWDAANLNMPGKSAFEDEEIDPRPIITKEIKATMSAASNAAPTIPDNADGSKKGESEVGYIFLNEYIGIVDTSFRVNVDYEIGTEQDPDPELSSIESEEEAGKNQMKKMLLFKGMYQEDMYVCRGEMFNMERDQLTIEKNQELQIILQQYNDLSEPPTNLLPLRSHDH
ncbi:eukaryotic translation initiation factor 5B-like [Capsicum annuum]|uniref:eukaryotic translation initiation factor 5B-like n=1 Tax=Capsicum annuum TaxID=4072 RepID=UPI001FB0FBF5|nr:eukaryotic translation initiation factor 5B-like [Capsicum annuum]